MRAGCTPSSEHKGTLPGQAFLQMRGYGIAELFVSLQRPIETFFAMAGRSNATLFATALGT
jgi:hypothetical protein